MVPTHVLLAIASAVCFLGLAHAAVNTRRELFQRMTFAMGIVAFALAVVAPGAGIALLGPIYLSRRMSNAPIPATVPELLERYGRRDRA
jgi:hypothetical protein